MTDQTIEIRPAKGPDDKPRRVVLLGGAELPEQGGVVSADAHVRYLLRTGAVERVEETRAAQEKQPAAGKPKPKAQTGSKED